MISTRAGQPAQPGPRRRGRTVTAYYTEQPDPSVAEQQVAFGTSGHRGSALDRAFNEATSWPRRRRSASTGDRRGDRAALPGPDTHGLSLPAWSTALEVLAANDVTVLVDSRDRFTPTPALSHAILRHNGGGSGPEADGSSSRRRTTRRATAGSSTTRPAGSDITKAVQDRANEILRDGLRDVLRIPLDRARAATRRAPTTTSRPTSTTCPRCSTSTRSATPACGSGRPLGGASVDYWGEIAERLRLDLTVVNPEVDPTWRFMTLDWDGKIRMDCSSPRRWPR